jgi:hypothetical protein
LLVDTGDGLLLTDFKTARSSWSEDHVADLPEADEKNTHRVIE